VFYLANVDAVQDDDEALAIIIGALQDPVGCVSRLMLIAATCFPDQVHASLTTSGRFSEQVRANSTNSVAFRLPGTGGIKRKCLVVKQFRRSREWGLGSSECGQNFAHFYSCTVASGSLLGHCQILNSYVRLIAQ